MLTSTLLAAVLAAGQAQGLPLNRGEIDCSAKGVQYTVLGSGRVRKLAELPPANHEIAITRDIGRCSLPVIVARDVEAGRRAPVRREGAPSRRR